MALSSSGRVRSESYILELDAPSAGRKQVGNMGQARWGHTCSLVGQKIVIVGGYGGSRLDTVEIFDIGTETWSKGTGKTCH